MRAVKPLVYSILWAYTVITLGLPLFLQPHLTDSPLTAVARGIIILFSRVLLCRYTFYMALSPFLSITKRQVRGEDYQPLVSVMIPAWNEEIGLLDTIKTVLESTYHPFEIIVVNDGSTDHSHAMMLSFLEKYHATMRDFPDRPTLLYHYQPNGGKGSALNTAIGMAHGEILISIDADCVVSSSAISAFVQAFRDPRVWGAVGNVKVGNTRTIVGTIQALEYIFGFYMKKADSLMNTIYIIGGAAGAFRREVFEQLGGYSTSNITEDIELSTRMQAAGMKIVYVPEAVVLTEGASTFSGLMKQRLRWKRGRFQTFWEHRSLFFSLEHHHNKLLTWGVLPLALFGDIQLALEPLFLLCLYGFSFLSGDFSGFFSSILIVMCMFLIQAWDSQERSPRYFLLAPIGWLLFYALTFVEVYALIKSFWLFLRRKEVRWQKWSRQGVKN